MNSQNIILEGRYYDGRQPLSIPATLALFGNEAALTTQPLSHCYAVQDLNVSPQIGHADRFINLPDGGQFQCADHSILEMLPHESRSEGLPAWLEQRWDVALAGVALIAVLLVTGYFYGLPAAADYVAPRIPFETELAVGRQALVWLDKSSWFNPTRIEQDRQNLIREGFERLYDKLPLQRYYRLEFRSSTRMGPNAFALPGGIIVITDDMVNAAESLEEVLAVLAHELGHVEHHHTLRSVLQNSVVGVVAATVTADAASLSAAVVGLPALLAQAKYSRQFEAEADEYAFRLLKERGYSPAAFASLMERLSEKQKEYEHYFTYVSSHPVSAERIQRARAAAKR
jgi:Zn-dependent protease with chaperone function